MAITLTSTQLVELNAEITLNPLGFAIFNTESFKIAEILNRAGTASSEIYIPSDQKVNITNSDFLLRLSSSSFTKVYDSVQASTNALTKGLYMLFNYCDGLDIAYPKARSVMDNLVAQGIIASSEAAEIKRLGEVLMSRSEELFNQKITVDDVIAARSL